MLIDDLIATVKTHIAHYEGRMKTFGPGGPSPNLKVFESSSGWIKPFQDLLEYLKEQQRLATPIPKSLGDISDLPDELVKELSLKRLDDLESQILAIMRGCDGDANLDQVLVGLYRNYKVVQTRRFIQNKLYRMSQKELVFSLPGQRAAYSLVRPSETEGEMQVRFQQDEMDDEIPF